MHLVGIHRESFGLRLSPTLGVSRLVAHPHLNLLLVVAPPIPLSSTASQDRQPNSLDRKVCSRLVLRPILAACVSGLFSEFASGSLRDLQPRIPREMASEQWLSSLQLEINRSLNLLFSVAKLNLVVPGEPEDQRTRGMKQMAEGMR